ncbi:MAG: protein kinase [Crocinitomicaceae bacterium]|nr:protein kinase [Crocinitomicaceae bacterium]
MSIAEQYQIIKKLGEQSRRKFGETYLVKSKESGDLAVLKAVRVSPTSKNNQERLKLESGFTFKFNGLPKILDFYESESEVILIKPFIEGITIDQYWNTLKRKQRRPFLIQFLQKIAPVFDHLVNENIVHADIKPSNILIQTGDDDISVHLIDFGLSLHLDDIDERTTLFPLGYAAPELILNHLDLVDQRSDIFALGVLIWRLYAGKLPLTHPNPSIFTNLQLTHPLPENSEIPKKLFKVLSKMCAKHQFKIPPNRMDQDDVRMALLSAMNERYNSLQEINADLVDWGKGSLFFRSKVFSPT